MTAKGPPRGNIEPVPTRQCGKESKGLLSPTQDDYTESRRAHYGETPKCVIITGESITREPYNVNDVKTKRNLTKNRSNIINDGFYNHSASG